MDFPESVVAMINDLRTMASAAHDAGLVDTERFNHYVETCRLAGAQFAAEPGDDDLSPLQQVLEARYPAIDFIEFNNFNRQITVYPTGFASKVMLPREWFDDMLLMVHDNYGSEFYPYEVKELVK